MKSIISVFFSIEHRYEADSVTHSYPNQRWPFVNFEQKSMQFVSQFCSMKYFQVESERCRLFRNAWTR